MNREKTGIARFGTFVVLLAATFWGSMGIFARFLNAAGLSAMNVTQVRVTVACLTVGLYLLLFRRDLLKIRLKDIWCFIGTGIVSLLLFCYCYFNALELGTGIATVEILVYTSPVFVMLMSVVLFKEKITKTKLCALVSAIVGCVFVSGILGGGEIGSASGVALATASGFFFALYSIFSRYAIERGYRSLTIVFYTFLFCTVGCSFLADWGTISAVVFAPAPKVWLLCLGLGIVTGFLPYVLYSTALESMESSKASILAAFEPVVGTLLAMLIFGEFPHYTAWIGIVLVLAAVVMLSGKGKKNAS